jgi:hypothetical protein
MFIGTILLVVACNVGYSSTQNNIDHRDPADITSETIEAADNAEIPEAVDHYLTTR